MLFRSSGAPVLAAIDLADGRRVKGCSLTVHAGEVVGLAGLIGAGRTELAHLIIGASPNTSGHIEIDGRAVNIRTPGEALDAGIAYEHDFNKSTKLLAAVTMQSGKENTLTNANVALQVKMTDRLALSAGYRLVDNSSPPPEIGRAHV